VWKLYVDISNLVSPPGDSTDVQEEVVNKSEVDSPDFSVVGKEGSTFVIPGIDFPELSFDSDFLVSRKIHESLGDVGVCSEDIETTE
jgi:hypothetical protein